MGMQSALDSAIGLPGRFDRRVVNGRVGDAAGREKDFHAAPESVTDPYAVETAKPPNAHRSRPDPASRFRKAFRNAEALASFRNAGPCRTRVV